VLAFISEAKPGESAGTGAGDATRGVPGGDAKEGLGEGLGGAVGRVRVGELAWAMMLDAEAGAMDGPLRITLGPGVTPACKMRGDTATTSGSSARRAWAADLLLDVMLILVW